MLERRVSDIIDKALKENTFGKGFKFRKNQRDVVETICKTYLEDPTSTIVVDAPTGALVSL